MKEFSFEKLTVWKQSKNLCLKVYQTTNSFPKEEKFATVSQARRSALSVCCNIAEGGSRWSLKEKSRFIEMAFGSLMELLNILIISNELGFLSEDEFSEIRSQIEPIGYMLNSLKRSYSA